MLKTPLSTVIGGAFWTPGCTVIGGAKLSFEIDMKKLFANGEQGFWYDPNDMGAMFQDAAGTVPVTGVGQAVGLIRDKSGNNNHAFATSSATRPILRKNAVTGAYYLEFDGSDDFLQTSNIDFTGTDKVSLFAGVRKLSDASIGIVVETTANSATSTGNFLLAAPTAGGVGNYGFRSKGISGQFAEKTGYAAPNSAVLTGSANISSSMTKVRINGTEYQNTSDQGGGTYSNAPMYIGRRAGVSLPFNGHVYGLIGIGKLTSDNETAAIEKELAKRTGVTL